MARDDDADDDDDGDDDGDHDDDDEDADVDVDVDGDELAALFSHYCSSNKSKSPVLHNRPLYMACGSKSFPTQAFHAATCHVQGSVMQYRRF